MAKRDLNLKDLKGYVLSPGDIFWIKSSGAEVLVAKKADYLNDVLVEKLVKAGHKLQIENQIDLSLKHEFVGLVKAHSSEVLFKEKLHWKKRIFDLLLKNKINQFELGQLAWMAWSTVEREEVKNFIDFDLDLFKRALNVATGFVFCSILLGYYHEQFLKNLFSSTLKNLMSMEKVVSMDKMKTDLESIRMNESLTEEERELIKNIFPKGTSWAGERYDGSGILSINKKEMNDLEKIMVALERHYSYRDVDGETIFSEIKNGKFQCDEKILLVLRRSLDLDSKSSELVA